MESGSGSGKRGTGVEGTLLQVGCSLSPNLACSVYLACTLLDCTVLYCGLHLPRLGRRIRGMKSECMYFIRHRRPLVRSPAKVARIRVQQGLKGPIIRLSTALLVLDSIQLHVVCFKRQTLCQTFYVSVRLQRLTKYFTKLIWNIAYKWHFSVFF